MNPLMTFHTQAYGKGYHQAEVEPYYKSLVVLGKRGFHFEAEGSETFESFLSVCTQTLYMTQRGPVHLIAPPGLWPWVRSNMDLVLRHMIRVRLDLGATREELLPIEEAVKRIIPVKKIFSLRREPEQWVSYGVILPPEWIKAQTLPL